MYDAPPRYRFKQLSKELLILIPCPKNWFLILFLGVWLSGWVIGETAALATILRLGVVQLFRNQDLFLVVWFVAWTGSGVIFFYFFAWQLTGREEISCTSEQITISRVFLGFSKPKVYFTEHVKDLRTVPLPVSPYRYRRSLSETAYSGLRVGVIAFDYGSRTIRFGVSLEETDAIEVVKLIKKRFPQYRE